jgi:hypothetical protein
MKINKYYTREIPRDFFNEAKLLKCMGLLSVKIEDRMLPPGLDIKIEESGEPFNICMNEDDYRLFVKNYPATINGVSVTFQSAYNSKSPYPFYCQIGEEEIEVFDNNGNFTEDFCNIRI